MNFTQAFEKLNALPQGAINSQSTGGIICKLIDGKLARIPLPVAGYVDNQLAITEFVEPTNDDREAIDWELVGEDEPAAAHQCCGKCEKPAADATEATVTDEQFRVIIDDLAHRLQTADAVIIALVQAAGGEVTIKGEDSAKVIGHQIVSEVSEDRQSFTFRAVPVPAHAVQ